MTRIDVPELEDQSFCPPLLRDALTDVLRISSTVFRLFEGAIPIIRDTLSATKAERIVDLCSGAGGPLLSLLAPLERHHGLRIPVVLTDKFPNKRAFARAEAEHPGQVHARHVPTDATAVPNELTGMRTIFNALHHFPPHLARAIFADAAKRRQPIASFEILERTPATGILIATLPPVVMAMTPFIRPMTVARFGMTYVVPVIPAAVWWDGFASALRVYSHKELEELVEGLGDESYRFRIERSRMPWLPFHMTTVVGMPVS
ncbi:MAG TPA: hypothetical protein VM580_26875 [Labilithrix sp.]|nr:hypothetical protein [Labilithrix sp.]